MGRRRKRIPGRRFSDFLAGSLPANTGRKMKFTGTTVLKLKDGKILEEIGLDDGVTALQQLGLIRARVNRTVLCAGCRNLEEKSGGPRGRRCEPTSQPLRPRVHALLLPTHVVDLAPERRCFSRIARFAPQPDVPIRSVF